MQMQPPEVFYKKGALKGARKIHRKTLFNNVAG